MHSRWNSSSLTSASPLFGSLSAAVCSPRYLLRCIATFFARSSAHTPHRLAEPPAAAPS